MYEWFSELKNHSIYLLITIAIPAAFFSLPLLKSVLDLSKSTYGLILEISYVTISLWMLLSIFTGVVFLVLSIKRASKSKEFTTYLLLGALTLIIDFTALVMFFVSFVSNLGPVH